MTYLRQGPDFPHLPGRYLLEVFYVFYCEKKNNFFNRNIPLYARLPVGNRKGAVRWRNNFPRVLSRGTTQGRDRLGGGGQTQESTGEHMPGGGKI